MFYTKFKEFSLTSAQAKAIVGSAEYNCKCNGVPTGTSSSPEGCAAKCDACVRNGGCKESLKSAW